MFLSPKTHYLNQTIRRVSELGRVPDMRRADHFLTKQLAPVGRVARMAARLKVPDVKIVEKLKERNPKIDDMRRVLEELRETAHNLTRSEESSKRAVRLGTASRTKTW